MPFLRFDKSCGPSCRPRAPWGMVAVVFLTISLLTITVNTAEAQTVPQPSTRFVYLQVTPQVPMTTDYSYIGSFSVQFSYTNNVLAWGFKIAPKWVQEAGHNLVRFDYTVTTRGRKVENYTTHQKLATYVFHSSMGRFKLTGDAPWTFHSLHSGGTVEIAATFSYIIPASTFPGLSQGQEKHSFWGYYRVGIR